MISGGVFSFPVLVARVILAESTTRGFVYLYFELCLCFSQYNNRRFKESFLSAVPSIMAL